MRYTIWEYDRPLTDGTPNAGYMDLTTEHPASSQGIPVLVWYDHRGRIAHVMGPGDARVLARGEPPIPGAIATHYHIPSDHRSSLWYTARDLVRAWLNQSNRTAREIVGATAFLEH